ncbi:hypothetical protein C8Q72DRAFT_796963 [Fomitopsis betulina]|nr:hypothetical protein C8Q72DRAFT_796963 [Fomitopsis betulina]
MLNIFEFSKQVYFISGLFSTMLYGTTCAQTMYYCYHYWSDSAPLKWLVVSICFLDTVATVTDVYLEYAAVAVTTFIVQMFYIHCIWQCRVTSIEFGGLTEVYIVAGTGMAAVADIYISVVLSWYFRKMKTGFKHTDGLLQRLSVYVINRGVLTASAQTGLLIMYILQNDNFESTWLIIHCIGGKLYVNSMMAVLNDRQYLKEKYTPESAIEF